MLWRKEWEVGCLARRIRTESLASREAVVDRSRRRKAVWAFEVRHAWDEQRKELLVMKKR